MVSTHIAIVLFLPIVIMPIVAYLTTRPHGERHCNVPGCCESFETTKDFITHMRNEHDYPDEIIAHMLKETKKN